MNDHDFDRTVSEAHLAAAGWQLGDYVTASPFQCHIFYIRDFRTGLLQLFTIMREGFEQTRTPFSATQLSGELSKLMLKLATGVLTSQEREILPSVLAGYFKATETYRLWNSKVGGDERLHAALNLYPGGFVRPFALRPDGVVTSAAKVLKDTEVVRAMDLARHPEWFDAGN